MTTPSNREKQIFEQAVEIKSKAERDGFVNGACGGDQTLAARVHDLLAAHSAETELLPESLADSLATLLDERPITEGKGSIIGRYKLLEKLGEGGFGVVWAAEQNEPVRRRIALKIIKLGMDTKQVVGRFEAERQALALMDHPNIARVLDAGSTDTGRPYFVMELVKGIPITKYCDQEKLSTQARLDLFIKVCHAIQHAHQKGIIHRDIKPSNIMVTLHDGVPVPKVIDFGIAKATQQELTEKTIYTQYSQFIGTPAYMSPEQAEMSGLDIDTRSDIYSLGVLLYELLTGSTPFETKELMQSGIDEMRKIIREKEPVRPSTRLSETLATVNPPAASSKSSARNLPSAIESDLDWIVMKCLEKDRARRYETANGMAADLKRHLNNEPVVARPPSAVYRFQKAWRRNRVAYTTGSAVVAALMIGIAVSIWQATVASKASREADTARIAEQEQKIAAQEEAERANLAEQREGLLRIEAEEQELVARRRAYAADMLLCREALHSGNLRRARLLLNRQRPEDGEEDLRGWEWRFLWKQCQGDFLSTPLMLGGRVLTASFMDNEDSILTLQESGRVVLWNVSTGREDLVLQGSFKSGHASANSGQLHISTNGELIAARSMTDARKNSVRIWGARNRSLISELPINSTAPLNALTLSPDKRWLAAYILNERVTVWNLETKQNEIELPVAGSAPFGSGAVEFSPDGTVLTIGDGEGRVRLVDVNTWTERTILPGRFVGFGVVTLDYSPDGRFLAAGSAFQDARIFVWDMQTNRKAATLEGHNGFIADVTFSPDGKTLASASGDQTIKLWNTNTWEEEDTLLGHTDEVWSVNFSSDGKRLISSGRDGHTHVWSASVRRQDRESIILPTERSLSGRSRFYFAGNVLLPGVAPDGKTIIQILNDGKVHLLETAALHERPVPDKLGDDNIAGFWLSPNEILIGSRSPLSIKIWNISNNTITTYPLNVDGEDPHFSLFRRSNLLVSTTGTFETGTLTITRWDTESRKELSSYSVAQPLEDFRGATFSQDGQWLAFADRGKVEVRNVTTGQRMPGFRAQAWGLQGLALLADQQRVVTASTEAPVMNVWDFATQEKLFSLTGHNLVIGGIAVSPDEHRIASATIGQEPIKIWDTEDGNEVASLEGRSGFLFWGLKFLPDGNTLAVSERNLETQAVDVRLLRAPTWEEINVAEAANAQ